MRTCVWLAFLSGVVLLTVGCTSVPAGSGAAAPGAGEPDGWEVELIPYVWVPASVSGDSTVAGGTVGIDLGTDEMMDLFDEINFAGSGRLEAWKGDWGFFLDGMYIDMGLEFTGPLGGTPLAGSIAVDITQGNLDVGVAHRLLDVPLSSSGNRRPNLVLEPLGGVRYVYLKQEIDVDPPGPPPGVTLGGSEDWVEPFVGARVRLELTDKLGLTVRGDVGGFGIGSASDLTWSVLAGARYRATDRLDLGIGYRYYDLDYSRGSGGSEFGLDLEMHGPWLGATWRF